MWTVFLFFERNAHSCTVFVIIFSRFSFYTVKDHEVCNMSVAHRQICDVIINKTPVLTDHLLWCWGQLMMTDDFVLANLTIHVCIFWEKYIWCNDFINRYLLCEYMYTYILRIDECVCARETQSYISYGSMLSGDSFAVHHADSEFVAHWLYFVFRLSVSFDGDAPFYECF